MASIHPELAEAVLKAARWLANDMRKPLKQPVLPLLRKRFGLSQGQAVQALFEAVHASALADGMTHEAAFGAALGVLAAAAQQPDAEMDLVRAKLRGTS